MCPQSVVYWTTTFSTWHNPHRDEGEDDDDDEDEEEEEEEEDKSEAGVRDEEDDEFVGKVVADDSEGSVSLAFEGCSEIEEELSLGAVDVTLVGKEPALLLQRKALDTWLRRSDKRKDSDAGDTAVRALIAPSKRRRLAMKLKFMGRWEGGVEETGEEGSRRKGREARRRGRVGKVEVERKETKFKREKSFDNLSRQRTKSNTLRQRRRETSLLEGVAGVVEDSWSSTTSLRPLQPRRAPSRFTLPQT